MLRITSKDLKRDFDVSTLTSQTHNTQYSSFQWESRICIQSFKKLQQSLLFIKNISLDFFDVNHNPNFQIETEGQNRKIVRRTAVTTMRIWIS